MAASVPRSRVFLDVSIGDEHAGRLVIELFVDKAPRTCENFRQICTSAHPPYTYKDCVFHRIIDEFMIQGGDITAGDGTGGASIYGDAFPDENLDWREIDAPGLVCMANRGKDTNSSQFFITLAPCEHLNGKHTVLGHLVTGKDLLERMAKVEVDKNDRPKVLVVVTNCGELERRKKAPQLAGDKISESQASSTERGRRKHRHSGDEERSRSPSPSRGHGRRSGSRHRYQRSQRDSHSPIPSAEGENEGSRTPRRDRFRSDRRRSEVSPDQTLRGRPRRRTRSPGREDREYRKRSTPPSRAHSRSRSRGEGRDGPAREPGPASPGFRRQRSFPNQYHREVRRREDWRHRPERDEGRLGGSGGAGEWESGGSEGGIIYKGRGAMKYRERNRW